MANLEMFIMDSNGAGWVPFASSLDFEVEVGLASVGMNKVTNLCYVCSAAITRGNVCANHKSVPKAIYLP